MDFSLIVPSFIAGLLTFLAPCTLPLVPGYLGFISGVGASRRQVFLNGLLYVIGFSAVFILIGSLFGLGGAVLAKHRTVLSQIGGVFIILFGLYMLSSIFDLRFPILDFLKREHHLSFVNQLKPGSPLSSLIFGATFALGWSPCVGPVLGAVLTLAASSATVGQGALLLAIFSLGLAVPFLAIAWGYASADRYIAKLSPYLKWVSVIGGVFLIFLGVLMLTNNFAAWLSFFYRTFDFLEADRLLDFL